MAEIDTGNSQMVGARADHVVVVMPRDWMTPTEALVHAAWLVTVAETTALLAGAELGDFDDIRRQVMDS
jgi:hypothetical protein